MDGLLNAPAFVILAFTLTAALFLVEVALPTFGIAGLSALALGAAGTAAVARQDEPWWPLVLLALAVCLWGVLLVRRSPHRTTRLAAAGLYALGGAGYGAVSDDPVAVGLALAAAAGLTAAYPPLLAVTGRLLDSPPQVGMEALVGRRARVERADGPTGTVRLDGSLWNALSSTGALLAGEEVLVSGFDGMMLRVTPVSVRP